VYTLSSSKRGLCAFDDKRYLLPDGVHTLAHGHYRARELQQQQQEQLMREEQVSAALATAASAQRIDEDENDFVVLSATQSRERSIRTRTHDEALSLLSGVNLREVMEQTVSNGWRPPTDHRPSAAKRARANLDYEEEDCYIHDGDVEDLSWIDAAVASVSFLDEF
jgi:hypothetical protein